MPGTIVFMLLMILKDWSSYLEEKNHLSSNLKNSSSLVNTGPVNGFLTLTIGLEMSTIFSLFGYSVLLVDLTSLRSTVEWSWELNMDKKAMDYQEMMTMQQCRLGTSLQLLDFILFHQHRRTSLAVHWSLMWEYTESWMTES